VARRAQHGDRAARLDRQRRDRDTASSRQARKSIGQGREKKKPRNAAARRPQRRKMACLTQGTQARDAAKPHVFATPDHRGQSRVRTGTRTASRVNS